MDFVLERHRRFQPDFSRADTKVRVWNERAYRGEVLQTQAVRRFTVQRAAISAPVPIMALPANRFISRMRLGVLNQPDALPASAA